MTKLHECMLTETHDDGEYIVDRRVPELRLDGTTVMRDPRTLAAYDTMTGDLVKDSVFDTGLIHS